MLNTGSPQAHDIFTNPDFPVQTIAGILGLTSLLASVTGGPSNFLSTGSSRENFPITTPVDSAVLPTSASQTTVFCKRVVIPTDKAILRMGPIRNTTYTTSGAVNPKIKYQLYTVGTDGKPQTKVTGIDGTCVLNTGTVAFPGACSAPRQLPYIGDYIVAWVYNHFAISVTANGTWRSSDTLYLGGTGATDGFWSDSWTHRGSFKMTVDSMFANAAAFDAFVFPDSIASLNPSVYTEEPNGPSPSTLDFFWTYQR